MRTLALSIVSLFLASCCCGGGSGTSGTKSSSTRSNPTGGATTAAAAAAPPEPAIPVTAAKLLGDYKGNEVRGDNAYKGKRVRVTGKVGEIKKDFTDSTYVTIGTGAQFEFQSVHCSLPDSEVAKASQLNKGQSVTAEGTVSGLIMGSVMLKDCEIK